MSPGGPSLMGKSLWLALLPLAVLVHPARGEIRLAGRVIDETKVGVPSARLSLRAANPADETQAQLFHTISDQTGAFAFDLPAGGHFLLTAERHGYFLLDNLPVELTGDNQRIVVVLNHMREMHESIDVAYSPPSIDFDETSTKQIISGTDVLFVPYPSTHDFKSALRIVPGAVVRDQRGEIHFNGGAGDQTYWTLDGFNITDPVTGRFDTQLSVESARSLTLSSGSYSAELGKGAAGVLAIETSMGDDHFRYSATNFIPGVENRKGLSVGDWRPRLNFSGPVAKGKAWFFNATDFRYNNHIVEELPKGEDRTRSHLFSDRLRGQINLTPSNILYLGGLVSLFNAPRSGLGGLDPRETTVDLRSRQSFFDAKNQLYFGPGVLLEFGYARNRTFGREIPQGRGIYIFTPEGRRGNFFADARRWGSRDQWLTNAILPSFTFAGSHQVKVGVDANRLQYRQDVERTGFERQRLDGSPRRRVIFAGDGAFRRSNTEIATYLEDSWKPKPNLLLVMGVRQDWDRLVRDLTTSPRLALSWSPGGSSRTKVSGGYAVVQNATSLQTFTRHLDQHTLTTLFDRQGTVQLGPLATLFTIDRPGFKAPRYHNWSLGLERRLPGDFYTRVDYLRRRGGDGLTFVDSLEEGRADAAQKGATFNGADLDALYTLQNFRRDAFDTLGFTVRKNFRKQAVWLASYTHSRTLSNAALDVSIDNPVLVTDNLGPTLWDSPNRLLSWAYVPLSKKWTLAYMLEWRSGFPFSVEDDNGSIVGHVNSWRLPDFFELNLHLERRFPLMSHAWVLRAGVVNLTGHQNPTTVNNNINSPDFLHFFGGTSRAFVTRIRWLGKAQPD